MTGRYTGHLTIFGRLSVDHPTHIVRCSSDVRPGYLGFRWPRVVSSSGYIYGMASVRVGPLGYGIRPCVRRVHLLLLHRPIVSLSFPELPSAPHVAVAVGILVVYTSCVEYTAISHNFTTSQLVFHTTHGFKSRQTVYMTSYVASHVTSYVTGRWPADYRPRSVASVIRRSYIVTYRLIVDQCMVGHRPMIGRCLVPKRRPPMPSDARDIGRLSAGDRWALVRCVED